jgi:hypothetical protein
MDDLSSSIADGEGETHFTGPPSIDPNGYSRPGS